MRRLFFGAGGFLGVLVLAAIVLVVVGNRPEPTIEDIVEDRLKGSEYGLVVGIVDEVGRRIVSRGTMYVGRYRVDELRSGMTTKEGNRLFVQPTMRPREELYPKTETEYFARISDTEVTFLSGQDGEPVGLVLHQGRDEMTGTKIEEQIRAVELEPETLEQLAGLYRYSPDFHLTVTRLGDRLFIQGTDQPVHELYARSTSTFFLTTVPQPGEVSFRRDSTGRVAALTVHAGRETETSRKIR